MQNVETARRWGTLLKCVKKKRSILSKTMSIIPVKSKRRPTRKIFGMSKLLKIHQNFQLPWKTILRDKFLSTAASFEYLLTLEQRCQVAAWGLLDRLQPSQAKIHPYNSQLISVEGTALFSVTYKNHAIPIKFFVLARWCLSILDGFKVWF